MAPWLLVLSQFQVKTKSTLKLLPKMNQIGAMSRKNIKTLKKIAFSANLAYFPSSVTKSAEHFLRCANKYFRTILSTGRMTEQARARRDLKMRKKS
jgi:hypothetical protein